MKNIWLRAGLSLVLVSLPAFGQDKDRIESQMLER